MLIVDQYHLTSHFFETEYNKNEKTKENKRKITEMKRKEMEMEMKSTKKKKQTGKGVEAGVLIDSNFFFDYMVVIGVIIIGWSSIEPRRSPKNKSVSWLSTPVLACSLSCIVFSFFLETDEADLKDTADNLSDKLSIISISFKSKF